jgi:hypothetical protein
LSNEQKNIIYKSILSQLNYINAAKQKQIKIQVSHPIDMTMTAMRKREAQLQLDSLNQYDIGNPSRISNPIVLKANSFEKTETIIANINKKELDNQQSVLKLTKRGKDRWEPYPQVVRKTAKLEQILKAPVLEVQINNDVPLIGELETNLEPPQLTPNIN